MGNPGVYIPLPSGVTVTPYYTRIDALTDSQGNPTDVITPDEGSVTVSGITDAGPDAGVIEAFLFGYQTGGTGLPEETQVDSSSTTTTSTDLNEKDSNGNELYSWSVTLPTTGLAPGVYALQSFVYTQAIVTTNGVPAAVNVYEPDGGTVTAQEFVPFTYVVREDTEIVTVGAAPTNSAIFLPNANATVQLSTDGRYVVWTNGSDLQEEDMQTGATVDLTATGGAAPALATNHSPTSTLVSGRDPLGPIDSGGYADITYPSFTEGGVTFGSISDFDFNPNNGSQNPLPTVTDSNGDTSVLSPFGVTPTMAGYAAAASDNGNAVLTNESSGITYIPYGSDFATMASPQYYVVYRSPAPTLTLDPVDGSNQFGTHGTVTLTGTSNAIGQAVEIDFGQAGAEVGSATVLADGSWSYSFDASTITGASLFIEASVSSAAGTPTNVSETAQVTTQPLPTLTSIDAFDEDDSPIFGPTETLTIELNTSEPVIVTGTPSLTLSNGEAATYSGGSGTDQIDFIYVPGIHDAGSDDLSVTGLNLPPGASIEDASGDPLGGPFDQALSLGLQTTPNILGLTPSVDTAPGVTTGSDTPVVTLTAEAGETVTVFDDGTVVGTGTVPDDGAQGIGTVDIQVTTPLPEGQSTLTASAVDASGRSSMDSAPVTITVDTNVPVERVLSLAVNGTDTVDLAHQAGLSVTITGRLSAALQPGESVVVVLPDGETQTVTPAAGVTGFTIAVNATEAEHFGIGGTISAYVQNTAGNVGATTNQAFTADSVRVITQLSADPADPSQTSEDDPSISGNGQLVAFAADPKNSGGEDGPVSRDAAAAVTSGIYLKNLSTGAVTLAVAGGSEPVLSSDGMVLAYVQDAAFPSQVYIDDLATGATTLVSANNGVAGDGTSFGQSLSADGTEVAFLSDSDNLVAGVGAGQSNEQVYLATLSGGAVTGLQAITVSPSDGTQGDGNSDSVALSADGSEVAFASASSNLLAAGDAHTANLGGFADQIYVKALVANAASGLQAGQVELVTGNADGSVGDDTSFGGALSADGRYLVFLSRADNLAPGNLTPGTTLPSQTAQVYVKDLLTGTLTLVSQTAQGVVGDLGALSASISADGQTIVFADFSDNLAPGVQGQQIYEATLSNGVVTGLTVVSEPGAIPGDGSSSNLSLSADGATVAFQSTSDNLAAGGTDSGPDPDHVYTTTITPATPAPPPVTLTVTNANDSGAGSLRAALAAAHDGDTIVFAPAVKGGTITLASSLTVGAGVTIDGLGSDVTVSGNGAVTVFDVAIASGQGALIEGLTITDGVGSAAAQPQAIGSAGGMTGTDTAGGVDLSQGVLTLLQDNFTNDIATGGDGGEGSDATATSDASWAGAGGGAGGAIAVGSGARLIGSGLTLSHNTATGGNAGSANDKAAGGQGGAAGGAIFADQGSMVSLTNLTLDDNAATGGIGGPGGGTGGGRRRCRGRRLHCGQYDGIGQWAELQQRHRHRRRWRFGRRQDQCRPEGRRLGRLCRRRGLCRWRHAAHAVQFQLCRRQRRHRH